jgi:hypothetical protein
MDFFSFIILSLVSLFCLVKYSFITSITIIIFSHFILTNYNKKEKIEKNIFILGKQEENL